MLRDRIQESVVDEARNLVGRAEALLQHRAPTTRWPRRSRRRQPSCAASSIDGDQAVIEDKMDGLLRMLAELEAAG